MSNAGYVPKPYALYIVEYSYLEKGVRKAFKRTVQAYSEEEAFEDCRKSLLITHMPEFAMKVVEIRHYNKK